MAAFSKIGTEAYPDSAIGGFDFVARCYFCQLWAVCTPPRHRPRDAGSLRAGRVIGNLHHSGDVYTLQRNPEDFTRTHSRGTEADGALVRWYCGDVPDE